jgi:hypothetical protein
MNRGGNKNSYFRQIAMPQSTGLPVLRPARRWPTRPGEERVPAPASVRESKPAGVASAQQPGTAEKPQNVQSAAGPGETSASVVFPADQNFQRDEINITPKKEAIELANEPLIPQPSELAEHENLNDVMVPDSRIELKRTEDRYSENSEVTNVHREIIKPAIPGTIESRSPGNRHAGRPDTSTNLRDRENDEVGRDRFFEPTALSDLPETEWREPSRPRQQMRSARSNGDRGGNSIQIGSIEVRVVTPAPVQPPPNRPQTPQPVQPMRSGSGHQSSGKLARGFRGSFGLRQE